jgi:hypothetical protein
MLEKYIFMKNKDLRFTKSSISTELEVTKCFVYWRGSKHKINKMEIVFGMEIVGNNIKINMIFLFSLK